MAWALDDAPDQTGRVVVITGGNSGVGLHAASMLVRRGARVVLACRDASKAEEARRRIEDEAPATGAGARGAAEVLPLDLADLSSVAKFAAQLAERHPAVDVLVNNAGVMGGAAAMTVQGLERQMGTNHFGHFALTAQVWPLLLAAPAARVVVLSSIAARGGRLGPELTEAQLVDPRPYAPMAVYANTKQANLLFAQELDRRARQADVPVRAIAVHPGVSYSNLFARQLREEGRGWLVPIADPVARLVLQSTRAGAMPTVRAVTDPAVDGGSFVGPTGFGQSRGAPELLEVYPQGRDEQTARLLWELSEAVTGVRFDVGARRS